MDNSQYSLDYIMQHRILTHKEEKSLAEMIKKGGKKSEKAKQELVRCNMRLVGHFVSDYDRGDEHLRDDLIGEGTLGLIRAAEKYNGEYAFSTYATWWIRQKVFKHLRSLIKLPDELRVLQKNINKIVEGYVQDHGHEPGITKIREMLERKGENYTEEQILNLFRRYKAATNISLDESHGESEENTRLSRISGRDENLQKMRVAEAIDSVKSGVERLPKLERYLIESVHFQHLELEEAAKVRGITYSRAKANYEKGIRRLKKFYSKK